MGPGASSRHARIYAILLGILAVLGFGVAAAIFFHLLPVARDKGMPGLTQVIGGVLYAAVSLFLAVTLVCRRTRPRAGRMLSRIANVLVMYPFFPLGVAVGVYGFWKVDREPKGADGSSGSTR